VQGEGAAVKLVQALAAANRRAECDVLLLVRGGGSIEDLWQFNEESLARAIRASAIPVVCGVGHETDFTIADFAADMRAPTPSAAAELVSPSRIDLLARIAELGLRLSRETLRRIEYAMQGVDALARRLLHPAERLRSSRQLLVQLARRLGSATARRLEQLKAELQRAETVLAGINHNAVLARGYSLTRNARGEILRDAAQATAGERILTSLAHGEIESDVVRRIP
jgi:exodeoxyribonuclease VII large subunit